MNTRGMWFARKCFHYNIPTGFFFYSFYLALPFFFYVSFHFSKTRTFHFISAKVWKIADSSTPFFSYIFCFPHTYSNHRSTSIFERSEKKKHRSGGYHPSLLCVSLLLTSWFSKSRDKSLLHGWQKGVKKIASKHTNRRHPFVNVEIPMIYNFLLYGAKLRINWNFYVLLTGVFTFVIRTTRWIQNIFYEEQNEFWMRGWDILRIVVLHS